MRNKLFIALSLSLLDLLYNWIVGFVLVFVPKRFRYKNVENEIVLITGGGSGLGQRLAIRFAELGSKVVIWDVSDRGNQQTVELAKKAVPSAKIWPFVCDVSNYESVCETARKVKQEIGMVNMLINNAGIVSGKSLLDLDEKDIRRTMDVNFMAHFWTCKAFLADMLATNHGHIVSIGSIAGLTGAPRMTDYSASKFATVGFEESLRFELKAEGYNGVKSTIVCPFFVNTGMFSGVRSEILSFLEPDQVVDEIVSAVLVNQEVLFIPRFMYCLYALKSVLPSRAMYSLLTSLGGDYAMKTFVGRTNGVQSNGRGI